MLHLQEVRDAASLANVVKISLSAWDQTSYEQVNRPHPQLRFDQLVEGQKAFRTEFKGKLWIEVFLVKGMNSSQDSVRKIAGLARQINPDRIQLNTAVRPPAEDFAEALPKEDIQALTHLFQPGAEVIAEFKKHGDHVQVTQETIFSMLQRRPCTADQIADVFGMHLNEISKYLGILMRSNQISVERKKNTIYYAAKNKKD